MTLVGSVQGVGFRPFVYRLAQALGVVGWVRASPGGIVIEAQAESSVMAEFLRRLADEAPSAARVDAVRCEDVAPLREVGFRIRASDRQGAPVTEVLPDLATCGACLDELRDPKSRRFGFPFISCHGCGPRYSLLRNLPFDRGNTSLLGFSLCPECAVEFSDPEHRHFQSQVIACHDCGPRLWACDASGSVVGRGDEAISRAVEALRAGRCVAVKSLAGFRLLCDGSDEAVIRLIRERKRRPSKPLAILCRSVEEARRYVAVSEVEARLLRDPAAPIVLLEKLADSPLPTLLAPGCRRLGVMLPVTPLDHLLLAGLDCPLVITGANFSEEPACFENDEALRRLTDVADLLLMHDRAIINPLDCSVCMVMRGVPMVLRRARGFVPGSLPGPPLEAFAVGSDLKNTFAQARGGSIFLSPHHGNMMEMETRALFARNRQRFEALFDVPRDGFTCHDLYPYSHTTAMAGYSTRNRAVQHHGAHLHACMGEHQLSPPVLGLIWDGQDHGGDDKLWGGEIILAGVHGDRRVGHLHPFPLPGGNAAMREPSRCALGLLFEAYGDVWPQHLTPGLSRLFLPDQIEVLNRAMCDGLDAPLTTSAGRLLDGLAALLGLCFTNRHDGEAMTLLEHAAAPGELSLLPFHIGEACSLQVLDWRPMVRRLVALLVDGHDVGTLAAAVHSSLAAMACDALTCHDFPDIVLSGGCFQNSLLLNAVADLLAEQEKRVWFPQRVPPNDGGIAYGQIWAAFHDGRSRLVRY